MLTTKTQRTQSQTRGWQSPVRSQGELWQRVLEVTGLCQPLVPLCVLRVFVVIISCADLRNQVTAQPQIFHRQLTTDH
jgi:hypothetical protein